MGSTFTQAVDYVNRNQQHWDSMIDKCFREWSSEYLLDSTFDDYALNSYGIRLSSRSYNDVNYFVEDPRKYSLFLIKFT